MFQKGLWHSLGEVYKSNCPFEEISANGGRAVESRSDQGSALTNKSDLAQADPVTLDPHLCPVPLFSLRREPKGAILIKGHDFVPVTKRGADLALGINGRRSLAALKLRFGGEALPFIYGLFSQGMVRQPVQAGESRNS